MTMVSVHSLISNAETGEFSLEHREVYANHLTTILLVEDDDTVRDVTAALLQEIGYVILDAATPQKALELCADNQLAIDLLLTDIIMPGMNGGELSDRIGLMRPAIRVLFMSGYTADHIDQKNVQTNGHCFIQKPFDLDSLHRTIQALLAEPLPPEIPPAECVMPGTGFYP